MHLLTVSRAEGVYANDWRGKRMDQYCDYSERVLESGEFHNADSITFTTGKSIVYPIILEFSYLK